MANEESFPRCKWYVEALFKQKSGHTQAIVDIVRLCLHCYNAAQLPS